MESEKRTKNENEIFCVRREKDYDWSHSRSINSVNSRFQVQTSSVSVYAWLGRHCCNFSHSGFQLHFTGNSQVKSCEMLAISDVCHAICRGKSHCEWWIWISCRFCRIRSTGLLTTRPTFITTLAKLQKVCSLLVHTTRFEDTTASNFHPKNLLAINVKHNNFRVNWKLRDFPGGCCRSANYLCGNAQLNA